MFSSTLNYFLKLKYKSCLLNQTELYQRQEYNWLRLNRFLEPTELAKTFKLFKYRSFRSLQNEFPILSYDELSPLIEKALNGQKNILFPGVAIKVGLTSGTTGKHGKEIPYNQKMIDHFSWSRGFNICAISNTCKVNSFSGLHSLSLASSSEVYKKKDISFGYISGILNQQIPLFLKGKMHPRVKLPIDLSWSERVSRLYHQVEGIDLQLLAGIPAVVLETLQSFCEHLGVENLKTIFPNLRYFVYGGTSISHFQKSIDEVCGQPLSYFGTYVATEAPIGLPLEAYQNQARYLLNPQILVNFQETNGNGKLLSVLDLEVGNRYIVVITMPNGFIHYSMKDEIEILSLDPFVSFTVIGRQGGALNLATEKITENGIANAIQVFQKEEQVEVRSYSVSPYFEEGKAGYEFLLFIDSINLSKFLEQSIESQNMNYLQALQNLQNLWSKKLDEILMKQNQDYNESRQSYILNPLRATVLKGEDIAKFIRSRTEVGQVKIPIIFRDRKEMAQFFESKAQLKINDKGILQ